MSESLFEVKSHQVPACHIREYAGSTSDNQEDVLWLDVKQYVPRQGETSVQTCAITLIATHAAAMPKVWRTCRCFFSNVYSLALGTIRAALGRVAAPLKVNEFQNQRHLDC